MMQSAKKAIEEAITALKQEHAAELAERETRHADLQAMLKKEHDEALLGHSEASAAAHTAALDALAREKDSQLAEVQSKLSESTKTHESLQAEALAAHEQATESHAQAQEALRKEHEGKHRRQLRTPSCDL